MFAVYDQKRQMPKAMIRRRHSLRATSDQGLQYVSLIKAHICRPRYIGTYQIQIQIRAMQHQ